MDLKDLKVAMADLYLTVLEQNKKISQLEQAGASLFKENEALKKSQNDQKSAKKKVK